MIELVTDPENSAFRKLENLALVKETPVLPRIVEAAIWTKSLRAVKRKRITFLLLKRLSAYGLLHDVDSRPYGRLLIPYGKESHVDDDVLFCLVEMFSS